MRLTTWRLMMLVGLGLILTGCAATREPGRYDLTVADQTGNPLLWVKKTGRVVYSDASKRDEATLYILKALSEALSKAQKLEAQLENVRDNLAKCQKPPEAKKADKAFDKIAEDAACETDLALASDPETPDDIRAILYKNVAKCRTRKQQEALDRMAERLPGKKKPADLVEGELIKELKPLPRPSLLREKP